MSEMKIETKIHPTEIELADFLSNSLPDEEKGQIEEHIASCDECLEKVVSAYESVGAFRKRAPFKKGGLRFMKKINIYLILAILSFLLSFIVPGHFLQFLVAALLLGIKWIVDAKSTKMLVMIYEAWRKGGEKEASRIIETLDSKYKR